jgi:hypothetical protein
MRQAQTNRFNLEPLFRALEKAIAPRKQQAGA